MKTHSTLDSPIAFISSQNWHSSCGQRPQFSYVVWKWNEFTTSLGGGGFCQTPYGRFLEQIQRGACGVLGFRPLNKFVYI